jgi:ABC-type dipeptide/oligopeptide/nickel transport system ATPase component
MFYDTRAPLSVRTGNVNVRQYRYLHFYTRNLTSSYLPYKKKQWKPAPITEGKISRNLANSISTCPYQDRLAPVDTSREEWGKIGVA